MKSEICLSYYSVDSTKLSNYSDFEALSNKLIQLKENLDNGMRKTSFSNDFVLGHENSILGESGDRSPDTGALMALLFDRTIGSNISQDSTEEMILNICKNTFEPGNTYYVAYCLEPDLVWPNVPNRFCVCTIENVYDFDCVVLSEYPLSNNSFIKRASTIFDNVYFSDNCFNSLNSIEKNDITYYSNPFVKALSALHNCASSIRNSTSNQSDLNIIGSAAGMKCTPQGSDKDKRFKFNFKIDENMNEIIFCEYHLKIHKCNNDGDSTYYHNRIYFGLKNTPNKGKIICVGHIGGHL